MDFLAMCKSYSNEVWGCHEYPPFNQILDESCRSSRGRYSLFFPCSLTLPDSAAPFQYLHSLVRSTNP